MEFDSRTGNGTQQAELATVSGDQTTLLDNDPLSNGTTPSSPGEGAPLQKGENLEAGPKKESVSGGCLQKGDGLRVLIISSIAFAIVVTAALILQLQFGSPQVPPHGAVAADIEHCSKEGVDILKKGGSAVDAAIATLLCNGVINAQSSGIGGGHFMLIHNHKKLETQVIDARETAPSAATEDMFKNNAEDKVLGGKSIAVPGELRGMEKAHQLYGKLPWADLFKPAIDVARKGFVVGKEIAKVLKDKVTMEDLKYSKALARIYSPGGVTLVEGQSIRREKLAMTLEKIANKGASEFYTGTIADEIVAEVKAKGGIMTKSDLEKYEAVLRPALRSTFRGQTVLAPPLPAGGATLLMMLNVMDSFNVTKEEFGTATFYQQLLEDFKYSYAEFFTLGDPDYNKTLDKRTEAIISKAYAEEIKNKINLTKTYEDPAHYNSMDVGSEMRGTTHISVVDTDELFVSVTSSINHWFGSKVMTPGGVVLNNHMADFSAPQDKNGGNKFNFIEPGKRPLSTMSPAVLHNTEYKCGPRMAIGASNGTRILTGMVEVVMNYYVGEETLKSSIDKPRIHDQVSPMGAWYEASFPQSIVEKLKSFGHTLKEAPEGLSVVQSVLKVNETLSAYSDPRKFGKAAQF